MRAPMQCVEAIYAHFDMSLSDDARERMQAFLAENQQDKHGRHVYTAEAFGLNAPSLHREFADYIDAFDIPTA
jgi:hypothetical protein